LAGRSGVEPEDALRVAAEERALLVLVEARITVTDYNRMVTTFGMNPVEQRWEDDFAELLEYPNADPVTGWPERLRHVW
jgi:hypothetical protein